MAFDNVTADAYGRFMGRYADPLAPQFADLAGVQPGQRVLDVGCGPGALTAVLVDRVGAEAVAAIDPSPPFVEAIRGRFPAVDVRQGVAEHLPFEDDGFDASLAQLVVHFMKDPVAGLREMARVTRPGGVVAACVWDHGGGRGPLSPFWSTVHALRPGVRGEAGGAGAREGHLDELATGPGCATSRAASWSSAWPTRGSTSGGRRTRRGSARPGTGSPASTRTSASGCGPRARIGCRRGPSRSPRPPGR